MNEEIFSATDIKVQLTNLKVYFPIKKGIFRKVIGQVRAVDGVDIAIFSGEAFGLVGESGCGKTTTGRAIIKLVPSTDGSVFFRTKNGMIANVNEINRDDLRRLRRDMQIIFQDPYYSLNPRMRVGRIIREPLIVNRVGSKESRRERVNVLLQLVGLDEYCVERYPHEFSGGQRQRIGIARALALDPSFVACDEPVSALDVSVQAQVINLLKDIQKELNLTMLFIAHDLSVVYNICNRIAVMYLGKIVEISDSDSIFQNPHHPYTEALMSAVPTPDPHIKADNITLLGNVPDASKPIPGCPFHTRCHYRQAVCERDVPALVPISQGQNHLAACHFSDTLKLKSVKIEEGTLHEKIERQRQKMLSARKPLRR